jgi:hypothetical protein
MQVRARDAARPDDAYTQLAAFLCHIIPPKDGLAKIITEPVLK